MIEIEITLNLTNDCFHWINERAKIDGYDYINYEIEDIIEYVCQKENFTEED